MDMDTLIFIIKEYRKYLKGGKNDFQCSIVDMFDLFSLYDIISI